MNLCVPSQAVHQTASGLRFADEMSTRPAVRRRNVQPACGARAESTRTQPLVPQFQCGCSWASSQHLAWDYFECG